MENTSKIETVEEHCKHPDCKYRQHLGSGYATECCVYILFTHESRKDKISECTKYKPRQGRIKTSPYEMYEER